MGNIRTGSVRLTGGTLIVNGTMTTMYQGLQPIPSGVKLGGALTYYMNDSRFGPFTANSGGIVAPGNPAVNGGVGTIHVQFNTGRAEVGNTTFNAGSIYEWQVAPANTTDLIHVVRTTTASNNNRTLTVGAMTLKILDAGGTPLATDQLPVFTYDASVVRNLSLGSVVFDTSALGAGWSYGGLALTDDGAGIIYLTGLSCAAGGTYWAPTASGGAGTWSATATNWATAPSTLGDKVQATTGTQPLKFTGTTGTVTVDGTVTVPAGISFESNGHNVTPGASAAVNLAGGDAAANTITVGAAMTATINVELTANNGLTKGGAGTLVLGSPNNNYSGGTTVNAGTLQINKAGALPPGGALTINAGGTVVLASGLGAASVASAGGAAPVPEPSTIVLLAAGVAALLIAAWRRRRQF